MVGWFGLQIFLTERRQAVVTGSPEKSGGIQDFDAEFERIIDAQFPEAGAQFPGDVAASEVPPQDGQPRIQHAFGEKYMIEISLGDDPVMTRGESTNWWADQGREKGKDRDK
jgi:hypothetical protein